MSKSLIIGRGARRHALARRLLAESEEACVWCTSRIPQQHDIRLLTVPQFRLPADICRWAVNEGIALAIVISETELCSGFADALRHAGIATFGPNAAAARIESDRVFAKQLFAECNIKTPLFSHFSTINSATLALPSLSFPCYGKVVNLSPSTYVKLLQTSEDAASWLQQISPLVSTHGIIFEEQRLGTEFSVTAFSDGKDVMICPPILEYKKAYEGDEGANTGGMGACCPGAALSINSTELTRSDIFGRLVALLAKRGSPFCGALTANFIKDEVGTWLLECNCHLGDPEISTIIAMFESKMTDLLYRTANGSIGDIQPAWKQGAAIAITIAASEYPGQLHRKIRVPVLDTCPNLFWYDVEEFEQGEVFAGGRLLSVCLSDSSVERAQARAYSIVDETLPRFHLEDLQAVRIRRDIGQF